MGAGAVPKKFLHILNLLMDCCRLVYYDIFISLRSIACTFLKNLCGTNFYLFSVHFKSSRIDKIDSHVLYEGPYRGPLYGLGLAELTTFPDLIITNAREMAEKLRRKLNQQEAYSDENNSDNFVQ